MPAFPPPHRPFLPACEAASRWRCDPAPCSEVKAVPLELKIRVQAAHPRLTGRRLHFQSKGCFFTVLLTDTYVAPDKYLDP